MLCWQSDYRPITILALTILVVWMRIVASWLQLEFQDNFWQADHLNSDERKTPNRVNTLPVRH